MSSKILIFGGGVSNFLSKMAWIHPPTHFKIVFECLDFFNLCNIPKAIPTLYSDQEETDYRVVLFIYLFNPHYTRKYI